MVNVLKPFVATDDAITIPAADQLLQKPHSVTNYNKLRALPQGYHDHLELGLGVYG